MRGLLCIGENSASVLFDACIYDDVSDPSASADPLPVQIMDWDRDTALDAQSTDYIASLASNVFG